MSTRPDDWEKPRGRQNHLTPDEISQLERRFKAGWTPRDAAKEIKCASRTAYRYFDIFRGRARAKQPKVQRPVLLVKPQPQPVYATVGRFYKGSFEL